MALALSAGWGCEREQHLELPESKVPGNLPPTSVGELDGEVMRRRLQGSWVVEEKKKTLWEFRVDGDRVEVVDRRKGDPITCSGRLVFRSATGFGCMSSDGVIRWYSVAWVDGRIHLGADAAVRIASEERFVIKLGAWSSLRKEGDRCWYVSTWAEEAKAVEISCSFEERDRARYFRYELPDHVAKGKAAKKSLRRLGHYLLDEEMVASVARPFMEAPPPPPEEEDETSEPER